MQSNDELMLALHAKDRQKLQELVSGGIRLNYPIRPSGVLPLVVAANSGDLEFCRFLLNLHVEGHEQSTENMSASLFNAIKLGFNKALETLISLGFGVSQVSSPYYGGSPLHLAVSNMNFDAVQILLDAGANINQAGLNGDTPIHCVCEAFDSSSNLNSILNYFQLKPHLNPKPDLSAENEFGSTPLICAANCKNIDAVNRLIKEGVNVDYISKNGNSALIEAVESGSEEVLWSLLHAGCSVNMSDCRHASPLSRAASKNNVTFCRILMENGANAMSSKEYLVLQLAIRNKNLDLLDLAVKAGASVNAQYAYGATPLMWAAAYGSAVVCRHLVHLGARLDIEDYEGQTALQYSFETATKHCSIYLIIEGSPRSDLSYSTAESRSDGLKRLLLRFLLLTEISPLKNILDRMQHKTRCIDEFQQMASCPHSLKHICRLTIREVLICHAFGMGIMSAAEKLPLPQSLKSHLVYEGEVREAQLSLFSDDGA